MESWDSPLSRLLYILLKLFFTLSRDIYYNVVFWKWYWVLWTILDKYTINYVKWIGVNRRTLEVFMQLIEICCIFHLSLKSLLEWCSRCVTITWTKGLSLNYSVGPLIKLFAQAISFRLKYTFGPYFCQNYSIWSLFSLFVQFGSRFGKIAFNWTLLADGVKIFNDTVTRCNCLDFSFLNAWWHTLAQYIVKKNWVKK